MFVKLYSEEHIRTSESHCLLQKNQPSLGNFPSGIWQNTAEFSEYQKLLILKLRCYDHDVTEHTFAGLNKVMPFFLVLKLPARHSEGDKKGLPF